MFETTRRHLRRIVTLEELLALQKMKMSGDEGFFAKLNETFFDLEAGEFDFIDDPKLYLFNENEIEDDGLDLLNIGWLKKIANKIIDEGIDEEELEEILQALEKELEEEFPDQEKIGLMGAVLHNFLISESSRDLIKDDSNRQRIEDLLDRSLKQVKDLDSLNYLSSARAMVNIGNYQRPQEGTHTQEQTDFALKSIVDYSKGYSRDNEKGNEVGGFCQAVINFTSSNPNIVDHLNRNGVNDSVFSMITSPKNRNMYKKASMAAAMHNLLIVDTGEGDKEKLESRELQDVLVGWMRDAINDFKGGEGKDDRNDAIIMSMVAEIAYIAKFQSQKTEGIENIYDNDEMRDLTREAFRLVNASKANSKNFKQKSKNDNLSRIARSMANFGFDEEIVGDLLRGSSSMRSGDDIMRYGNAIGVFLNGEEGQEWLLDDDNYDMAQNAVSEMAKHCSDERSQKAVAFAFSVINRERIRRAEIEAEAGIEDEIKAEAEAGPEIETKREKELEGLEKEVGEEAAVEVKEPVVGGNVGKPREDVGRSAAPPAQENEPETAPEAETDQTEEKAPVGKMTEMVLGQRKPPQSTKDKNSVAGGFVKHVTQQGHGNPDSDRQWQKRFHDKDGERLHKEKITGNLDETGNFVDMVANRPTPSRNISSR